MSTTIVCPVGDRLLVKKDEQVGSTKSGIILPERAKEECSTGIVQAVGPGRIHVSSATQMCDLPMCCKVGDRVLFNKFGGHEVSVDGEDFFLLGNDEVLAVLGTKEAA